MTKLLETSFRKQTSRQGRFFTDSLLRLQTKREYSGVKDLHLRKLTNVEARTDGTFPVEEKGKVDTVLNLVSVV